MLDIGKVIERYLRCTDVCIEAYAQAATISIAKAVKSYDASHQAFQTLCDRQEDRLFNASGAERVACAQSWVNEHLERKVFLRMELLLVTVRDQAAAATATSGSLTPTGRCGWLRIIRPCIRLHAHCMRQRYRRGCMCCGSQVHSAVQVCSPNVTAIRCPPCPESWAMLSDCSPRSHTCQARFHGLYTLS